MSVTINFSKNTSAPWQSNANMLKSTREKYRDRKSGTEKLLFLRHRSRISKIRKRIQSKKLQKSWRSFILTRMRLRQQNRSTTAHRCSTS